MATAKYTSGFCRLKPNSVCCKEYILSLILQMQQFESQLLFNEDEDFLLASRPMYVYRVH